MSNGLSIYIDGVVPIDADDGEEFHNEAIHIEAEIESTIAQALEDHEFIESGATVTADYVQEKEE